MSAREVLDGIKARLAEVTNLGQWETTRVNDVVIYAPSGFGAYKLITHSVAKADAEFIAAAPSDVARLAAAVEAVLALHYTGNIHGTVYCKECSKSHWIVPAPCPTVTAIENAFKDPS